MAIMPSRFTFNVDGAGGGSGGGPRSAEFEQLLAYVCATYNLNRKDFSQSYVDPRTGIIKFAFNAPDIPPHLAQLANQLHDMLSDELRGAVIRAAVPDFSRLTDELANAILNPQKRVIEIDPSNFKRDPLRYYP